MTKAVLDPERLQRLLPPEFRQVMLVMGTVGLFLLGVVWLARKQIDTGVVADRMILGDAAYLIDQDGRSCLVGPGRYVMARVGDDVRCRWQSR